MPAQVHSTVPKQPREATLTVLSQHGIQDEFGLLGVRGYYRRTMGDPTHNDRGIYDDAIMLLTPTAYVTFNANCDPTAFRPGIANLNCGVWQYKIGTHGLNRPVAKQYKALVQAGPVTVTRDQRGADTGWFGINIHRGGFNTTSSLGCQTIYPPQWPGFITMIEQELKRHGRKKISYVLVQTE